MAVMAVKIEEPSTLLMNEFFDYNGTCYGVSRSRNLASSKAVDMEDFYEGTLRTQTMENIPVVFLWEVPSPRESLADNDGAASYKICGWYRTAKVHREVVRKSLYLEGNIEARATDAVLLPTQAWIPWEAVDILGEKLLFQNKLYTVIESDDSCYERLMKCVRQQPAKAVAIRYDLVQSGVNKNALNQAAGSAQGESRREACYAFCLERCMDYAAALMNDQCQAIGDIKTLREYAQLAILYGSRKADGYYYKAMAEEQLGFFRDGMKSIAKALELEPDGADILALKANLLVGMGKYDQAMALYQESYDISGDESYLLVLGRVHFLMGNVDGAYKVYEKITDKELLKEAGISLKDMEHKWPFVAIRGIKNLLKRS